MIEFLYDGITDNNDTLLRQAPMTADEYLRECITIVDSYFGKGTAQKNPMLAIELTKVCAEDFGAALRSRESAKATLAAGEAIAEKLGEIADKIEDVVENIR